MSASLGSGFSLHWVAPELDGERAVDALGFGAQADRIADQLLPGLSSATRRARYLSFLCWAVHRTKSARDQHVAIHRLEATHACEEVERHSDEESTHCPDIIGRLRARQHLATHEGEHPSHPERLYKNTAFATYRPLMRALGLVTAARRVELTDHGRALADAHHRSRGAKPRCLTDVSAQERRHLLMRLGLDLRTKGDERRPSARRRAAFVELRDMLRARMSPAIILERYAGLAKKPSTPARLLHQAFAWELQSLGLSLAFAMLLESPSIGDMAKRLRAAMKMPALQVGLGTTKPSDEKAARQVVSLLRRAYRMDIASLGLDSRPGVITERLVVDHDVEAFLRSLVDWHARVKLESAWIRLDGKKVEILATKKKLDLQPRARSYRIDALAQLARDLRLLG